MVMGSILNRLAGNIIEHLFVVIPDETQTATTL